MEALNAPNSFMQSFTIALCRYFSAHRLFPDTELKYSDLNACVSDPSEVRKPDDFWLVSVLELHRFICTVIACPECSKSFCPSDDIVFKGYQRSSARHKILGVRIAM
jgi:hypothetical protein